MMASGGSAALSAPTASLGIPAAPAVEPATWRRFLRVQYLIPFLAFLGILDSLYLSYVKIAHAKPFCSGLGDCETVNSSAYSTFAGIPIAFLGVGMYAVVFILAMWGPKLPGLLSTYAPLLIFGIGLGGVLDSAYLTYLELYVIEAICIYCVGSAILITLIFLTSLWFLLRGQPTDEPA
jgi:uncharacterized membrane protein